MYFLLCQRAVFDYFLKICDHFLKIFEDFSKLFRRPDERFRTFSDVSEDCRRLPKGQKRNVIQYDIFTYNNYSMSPSWIWSDKMTNERVARVGYNHFRSSKGEWNNCFSKFSNRVLPPIFISTILQSGKFLNLAHYFPFDVKLRLLAHSRSFLANQKARNAIVGAENLLCEDMISTHVRISYCFYQFVTTRYTTDFYTINIHYVIESVLYGFLFTSWKTHSFAALTRSFSKVLQLVNKNPYKTLYMLYFVYCIYI